MKIHLLRPDGSHGVMCGREDWGLADDTFWANCKVCLKKSAQVVDAIKLLESLGYWVDEPEHLKQLLAMGPGENDK